MTVIHADFRVIDPAGLPRPCVVYTDPPWNQAWVTRYRAMSGLPPERWSCLMRALAEWIAELAPEVAYVEVAQSGLRPWLDIGETVGLRHLATWRAVYGKGRPCYLTSWSLDERDAPDLPEPLPGGEAQIALALAGAVGTVVDPCAGHGMTGRVASRLGLDSVLIEQVAARAAKAGG